MARVTLTTFLIFNKYNFTNRMSSERHSSSTLSKSKRRKGDPCPGKTGTDILGVEWTWVGTPVDSYTT